MIADMSGENRRQTILKGGRGGAGNQHFATSTMQVPKYAQPGQPAQELEVLLELKVIADVGLVGFPNVGKSTLLSRVTNAQPKIANYHFTTLTPNLGVVDLEGGGGFVIADIPGLIEGASEGVGLGHEFLRHIERNAVLLFMVPADTVDVAKEYDILLNELERFNPDLADKGRVLAVTKCDMLDDELIDEMRRNLPEGVPTVFISSVSGLGLTELKDLLWRTINDEDNRIPARITHRDLDVLHRVQEEDTFVIEQEAASGEEETWDVEWPEEYWEDDFKDD